MKEERTEMQDTRTQFKPRRFKKYCQHCLLDILGDAILMQEKVSFPGLPVIYATHYLHPDCAKQMEQEGEEERESMMMPFQRNSESAGFHWDQTFSSRLLTMCPTLEYTWECARHEGKRARERR